MERHCDFLIGDIVMSREAIEAMKFLFHGTNSTVKVFMEIILMTVIVQILSEINKTLIAFPASTSVKTFFSQWAEYHNGCQNDHSP
jgi:hypothetical protein